MAVGRLGYLSASASGASVEGDGVQGERWRVVVEAAPREVAPCRCARRRAEQCEYGGAGAMPSGWRCAGRCGEPRGRMERVGTGVCVRQRVGHRERPAAMAGRSVAELCSAVPRTEASSGYGGAAGRDESGKWRGKHPGRVVRVGTGARVPRVGKGRRRAALQRAGERREGRRRKKKREREKEKKKWRRKRKGGREKERGASAGFAAAVASGCRSFGGKRCGRNEKEQRGDGD